MRFLSICFSLHCFSTRSSMHFSSCFDGCQICECLASVSPAGLQFSVCARRAAASRYACAQLFVYQRNQTTHEGFATTVLLGCSARKPL
jgi:hypothetical protein